MLSRISPPTTSISYIKTSTNSRDSSTSSKKSNYSLYKDCGPTVYDYDGYSNNNDDTLSYEDLRPEYDEDGMEIDYSDDSGHEY